MRDESEREFCTAVQLYRGISNEGQESREAESSSCHGNVTLFHDRTVRCIILRWRTCCAELSHSSSSAFPSLQYSVLSTLALSLQLFRTLSRSNFRPRFTRLTVLRLGNVQSFETLKDILRLEYRCLKNFTPDLEAC